jgi:hypothetical protein
MNRGHRVLFGVREQNGNAVCGLNGQQDAGLAGDKGVTFGSLLALRECGGGYDVHDIGVDLTQRGDAHFAGAERSEKFRAILCDAVTLIPFRESEVQDFFRRALFPGL